MPWPHCLNNNIFSNHLNWPHSLRLGGRLFQTCGPAMAKALYPKLLHIRLIMSVQWYRDYAIKFTRWQHPAMKYWELSCCLHVLFITKYMEINAARSICDAGSMVPFDMRMLHAELPQHVGRLHDSVDRLCHLRTVISQVCLIACCIR